MYLSFPFHSLSSVGREVVDEEIDRLRTSPTHLARTTPTHTYTHETTSPIDRAHSITPIPSSASLSLTADDSETSAIDDGQRLYLPPHPFPHTPHTATTTTSVTHTLTHGEDSSKTHDLAAVDVSAAPHIGPLPPLANHAPPSLIDATHGVSASTACPTQVDCRAPSSGSDASKSSIDVVDDSDLLSYLLPSSTTPINVLAASNKFPEWIIHTLQLYKTDPNIRRRPSLASLKQYLLLACRSAIDVDFLSGISAEDRGSLYHTKDELTIADSHSSIPYSKGIQEPAVRNYAKEFQFASRPLPMDLIDAMCRRILQQLQIREQHKETTTYTTQLINKLHAHNNDRPIDTADKSTPIISSLAIPSLSLCSETNVSSSSPTAPTLASIRIISIPGTGCQCFWASIEKATGTARETFRDLIRDTVQSIDDPQLLFNLGFWEQIDDWKELMEKGQQSVIQKKKDEYINSRIISTMEWATTREMLILSYAYQGKMNFRTVASSKEQSILTRSPSTLHEVSDETMEIALYYSPYEFGGNNQPNHFDLFEYVMSDNSSTLHWKQTKSETHAQLMFRLQLLQKAADDMNTKKKNDAIIKSDKALADILYKEENGWESERESESEEKKESDADYIARVFKSGVKPAKSSPTRDQTKTTSQTKTPSNSAAAADRLSFSPKGRRSKSTMTATNLSQRKLHLHTSSTVRAVPPSSRSVSWKQRRVSALREIHRDNCELFRQSAGSLFEAYRIHAEKNDVDQCQRVAQAIMDYPSKSLIKKPHMKQTHIQRALIQSEAHVILEQAKRAEGIGATVGTVTVEDKPIERVESTVSLSFDPTETAIDLTGLDDAKPQDHELNSIVESEECDSPHTYTDSDSDADSDQVTRAVRNSVRIYNEGGPHSTSRAAMALGRTPEARMNAALKRKLRELHPSSSNTIPPLPSQHSTDVIEIKHLGQVLKTRIHNGSAPGPSGWTGSHLMMLWGSKETAVKKGMELFIRDICNGVFTDDMKQRLLACRLIPLSKKNNGVRPVAVGEVFTKCAAHCVMSLIEDQMKTFFPSIQYGVKRSGGSETAAQLVRSVLDKSSLSHANVIVLKTDFKNAFNSVSRSLVWKTLLRYKQAEPILKAFHYQYADPSPLLVYHQGKLFDEIKSTEGVRQGCPFAAFAFALTVQSLYESAIQAAQHCHGVSIQDDLSIIGPADEVMKVYDYILQHAASEFSLELCIEKCQVYIPTTVNDSTSIIDMCRARKLHHDDHMESLGVMYGSDEQVEQYCEKSVSDSELFFRALTHPEMPAQIASSLLRYCGIPRLGYLARTAHPDRLHTAAKRFDQLTLDTLLNVIDLDHRSLSAQESNLKDDTNSESYVSREEILTRLRLPISLGGLGVRSVELIRHAAYFSSLMQTLPEFLTLYADCHDANTFKQTLIAKELKQCRDALIDTGATQKHVTPAKQSTLDQWCGQKSSEPSHVIVASATQSVTSPHSTSPLHSSPSPALVQSIDESLAAAVRFVKEKQSNVFSTAIKLQQQITHSIEKNKFIHLFNSASRYQQTIMTALTMNVNSSSFLTAIPTQHEAGYRMNNERFRLSIRHRLGLMPYDELVSEECLSCLTRTIRRPSFLADPDHLHSCTVETGASVSKRHHQLVLTLMKLAKSVGYHTTVEPNFPPIITTTHDEHTKQLVYATHQSRERGDLLLIRGNQVILIDVSITRPTSTANMRLHAKINETAGIAAAAVEKRKHATYDVECKLHGWRLVPFVLESYGGLGSEANKLLLDMAEHDDSPLEFILHARNLLSVALQSGNADVAIHGTTSHWRRKVSAADRRDGYQHLKQRQAHTHDDSTQQTGEHTLDDPSTPPTHTHPFISPIAACWHAAA